MAVPKKKISKTKGRTRRTHYKVDAPGLSKDKSSGLFVMPHRINPTTGRYKGKKVIDVQDF